MRYFYSIIVVFLFLIGISTPPLLSLFTPDQDISATEKRKLTPIPEFAHPFKELPGKFEEYYKDHFGLRDFLILFNNLCSFQVFKDSSVDVVTVGKDGWLFYTGEDALYKFMGGRPQSSVYLESYRRTLMDREEWLADRGVRYIFVPVPNKMTIYPEFLPDRLQRQAGTSLYDQVFGYLNKHPGFDSYLDLKETFLKKKHDTPLYFRTDSHWNLKGAFVAYQAFVSMVEPLEVPIHTVTPESLLWKEEQFSGDLAKLLHLEKYIEETIPALDTVMPCGKTEPLLEKEQANREQAIDTRFAKFSDDPRAFTVVRGCADTDSTVLVIHDSFGHSIRPFLSHSFGTLIFVQLADLNDLKDFIEWVQPDLVIDQRVERYVLKALAPDRDIQTTIVKKRFAQSDNYRLQIDKDTPQEVVRHLPSVQVVPVADGLRIQSAEKYPFVGFTFDPGDGDGPLMVRIRLTSEQKTSWLLYYTTAKVSGFVPAQSISLPLKKGYNEFYFRLPYPDTTGELQFHPGAAPGAYTLHSFAIKREDRFIH